MRTSYIMPITGSFSSHKMRLPWCACFLLSAEIIALLKRLSISCMTVWLGAYTASSNRVEIKLLLTYMKSYKHQWLFTIIISFVLNINP